MTLAIMQKAQTFLLRFTAIFECAQLWYFLLDKSVQYVQYRRCSYRVRQNSVHCCALALELWLDLVILKTRSFLNGQTPASFLFIFGLPKLTIQFLQQINAKNAMSIQYTAPAFKPTISQTRVVSHNHQTWASALQQRILYTIFDCNLPLHNHDLKKIGKQL